MIQERYCSLEVSKLLKEKGFDEACLSYFWTEENDADIDYSNIPFTNKQLYSGQTLRPTHQMAIDWLIEVHNIFIIVEPYSNTSCYFSLWEGDDIYRENPLRKDFPSYGETVEAALKYCLTKSIK